MLTTEEEQALFESCLGLWSYGLFQSIPGYKPDLTLDEHQEIFFYLIFKWLKEGRIKFIAPDADCYTVVGCPPPRLTIQDEQAWWKATPSEIVEKLKATWPQDAADQHDLALVDYFYDVARIPGLIWVAEDGSLLAS